MGYQYRGATKVANTTVSITDQDAYDVVDLGFAYTTAKQSVAFRAGRQEILDEEYRVAGYDFGNPGVGATGGFSQIGFYGPPRTCRRDRDVQVLNLPSRVRGPRSRRHTMNVLITGAASGIGLALTQALRGSR